MTTIAAHWSTALETLGACQEAQTFASRFDSLQAAWDACERADWLLWLLGKKSGRRGSEAHRTLVLTACQCARRALHFVPTKENRPHLAIETVERWAKSDVEITLDDVKDAAYAANAAAYAAYAADAADAANAADAAANAADAAYAEHKTMCVIIRERHACPIL